MDRLFALESNKKKSKKAKLNEEKAVAFRGIIAHKPSGRDEISVLVLNEMRAFSFAQCPGF